jgi:hypothetical protein
MRNTEGVEVGSRNGCGDQHELMKECTMKNSVKGNTAQSIEYV